MAVITVSREYGSRGEQIAQQVAKELGYSYFDKEILTDVARAANTTQAQISPYDEQEARGFRGFLKDFFIPKYPPAVEWLHYAPELYLEWSADSTEVAPTLDADKVISFFRHVIESLWKRDNVVIVGRGSQMILAAKPNTSHLRFLAPIDDRIEQIMEGEGILYPKALKRIQAIDKQRADYLKHCYDADWADPKLYHLVLNTGSMDAEQAAKVIITAVRHQENQPREGGEVEQWSASDEGSFSAFVSQAPSNSLRYNPRNWD